MTVQPRNPFRLAGSVGRSGENRRDDVIKAQLVLAETGDYRLPDPGMPTGWPGGELERAVIRAQKRLGLQPDGVLLPLADGAVGADGSGETWRRCSPRLVMPSAAGPRRRLTRSTVSMRSMPGGAMMTIRRLARC